MRLTPVFHVFLICITTVLFSGAPLAASSKASDLDPLQGEGTIITPRSIQPGGPVGFQPVGNLGGINAALLRDGSTLYLGEGSAIVAYDVTDSAQPTRTARIETAGVVRAMHKVGSRLFVADDRGLTIIEVSGPTVLTTIGRHTSPKPASSLDVAGNLIYLGLHDGRNGEVQILDMSVPTTPVLRGILPSLSGITGVQVEAGIAYVSYYEGITFNNGLAIFRVDNPATPTLIHRRPITPNALGIHVAGNRAYFHTSSGVQILDITTPASPTLLGTATVGGYPSSMRVVGDTIYLSDSQSGPVFLHAVDVSDPATPQMRKTIRTRGTVTSLENDGDTVYAAQQHNFYGVQILDMGADLPGVLGEIRTVGPSFGVSMVGDRLYSITGGGLNVFSVSDTAAPSLIGSLAIDNTLSDIQVSGSRAYLSSTNFHPSMTGGVHIVDLSDPTAPALIHTYESPYQVRSLDVVGNFMYLSMGAGPGFQIVDISDPTNPVDRGSAEISGVNATHVVGNLAYLANGSELTIADVSNPARPTVRGSYQAAYEDITVVGGTVYGVTGWPSGKLEIIDVTNPARPTLKGSLGLSEYMVGVQVLNGYAYIINFTQLLIVNVNNPAAPRFRAAHPISNAPQDLLILSRAEPGAALSARAIIAGTDSSLFIADLAGYDLQFPLVRR